jgi:glyoxylase-like metal-dependent hydrolase (beta-lactamase superfamily II)/rhodanese-related sulfurtransferase
MEQSIPTIDSETLRDWLEKGRRVNILDVRPVNERSEWFIPGSLHINAYNRLKAGDSHALDGIFLDKEIPVITVCAEGRMSRVAATMLQKKGYNVYSLESGMKSWSLAWNTAILNFQEFQIIQVRRTGKGCLSYIIVADKEAVIVDASLPEHVYENILNKKGIGLKYVMETHIHADHLSRSKQLAEKINVPLYLPVPNKVKFDFYPVDNTTELKVGKFSIKVIQTPGHTLESVSFLIDGKALLTGDTLFINGIGRPDLKADAKEIKQKSKLLYQSLQKLFSLPEDTVVLPAHTNQPVDFNEIPVQSTLGAIRKNIPLLDLREEAFADTLLQLIPPTPTNYLSIVEINLSGDFSDINPVDLEAGANRCAIS